MTQQPMTESELKEFLTALRNNCGNKKKVEWYDGLIEDIEIAFTEHIPDAGKMIEEIKEPNKKEVQNHFFKTIIMKDIILPIFKWLSVLLLL
jgi:endo-beta-N-acetylglucosaminidase D